MARGTGRWLWALDDGCARLETRTDFCLMANDHRGDARCNVLQSTISPMRTQSDQRFGTQVGNLIDSGLKGLLHRFRLPFQHGSGRKDVGTLPRCRATGCFLRLASLGISHYGMLGLRRLLRLASLGISPRGRLGSMVCRMLLPGLQTVVLLRASGRISHGGGLAM